MFKPGFVDTGFDSRREVFRLLARLTKEHRSEFLRKECKKVSNEYSETRVVQTDGTPQSAYWDLMSLCYQFGVDIDQMGCRLVEFVRSKKC